jgi:uncharacterized membrane protein YozB (DUF420 family)
MVLLVVALTAALFVFDGVLQYFVWSEDTYGPYYWQHRVPLIFHVAGGTVALLAGLYQLYSGLSGSNMKVHPIIGRIYLVGVGVGTISALILSVTSAVFGPTFGVALFCMALAWISITGMAVCCIRKRNVRMHKQWMIRSYIVTFGFVTFRIVTDYVPYEAWWGITQPEISNATVWAAWVVPLIIYEILVQSRDV